MNLLKQVGLKKQHMLTPALTISVADNGDLELIGTAFMNIQAPGFTTSQLVYFATDIGKFYLSKAACIDLGIIIKQFSQVSSCGSKGSRTQVNSKKPSLALPDHNIGSVSASVQIHDEVFDDAAQQQQGPTVGSSVRHQAQQVQHDVQQQGQTVGSSLCDKVQHVRMILISKVNQWVALFVTGSNMFKMMSNSKVNNRFAPQCLHNDKWRP